MSDAREEAIDAIAEQARARRSRPSRRLWMLSLIVGVGCAAAFVIALVSEGDAPPATAPRSSSRTGLGFGAGVVVGVGAGALLGFAVARQLGRDRRS